jgi:hypothetical protein
MGNWTFGLQPLRIETVAAYARQVTTGVAETGRLEEVAPALRPIIRAAVGGADSFDRAAVQKRLNAAVRVITREDKGLFGHRGLFGTGLLGGNKVIEPREASRAARSDLVAARLFDYIEVDRTAPPPAPAPSTPKEDVQALTATGLTHKQQLFALDRALADWRPQSSSDLRLLRQAWEYLEVFEPQDGADLNAQDGLEATLLRQITSRPDLIPMESSGDLFWLARVIARFSAEDGKDLNALEFLRKRLGSFDPQDGSDLNAAAALGKTLDRKLGLI